MKASQKRDLALRPVSHATNITGFYCHALPTLQKYSDLLPVHFCSKCFRFKKLPFFMRCNTCNNCIAFPNITPYNSYNIPTYTPYSLYIDIFIFSCCSCCSCCIASCIKAFYCNKDIFSCCSCCRHQSLARMDCQSADPLLLHLVAPRCSVLLHFILYRKVRKTPQNAERTLRCLQVIQLWGQ